jgi:hypothetical protein
MLLRNSHPCAACRGSRIVMGRTPIQPVRCPRESSRRSIPSGPAIARPSSRPPWLRVVDPSAWRSSHRSSVKLTNPHMLGRELDRRGQDIPHDLAEAIRIAGGARRRCSAVWLVIFLASADGLMTSTASRTMAVKSAGRGRVAIAIRSNVVTWTQGHHGFDASSGTRLSPPRMTPHRTEGSCARRLICCAINSGSGSILCSASSPSRPCLRVRFTSRGRSFRGSRASRHF